MINVTLTNFETEVIEASKTKPVLVDFWASWCDPCKTLGPLLEKIETDYKGRFSLAKVDVDTQQQLASAFGVSSLPTVLLVVNGQPVDGFTGALPETQIKTFLDKHVPKAQASESETQEDQIAQALQSGDVELALEALEQAIARDSKNEQFRFDYAKLLIQQNRVEDAKQALVPVTEQGVVNNKFNSLVSWLDAIAFVQEQTQTTTLESLQEKINRNKRNFEARFACVQFYMQAQKWTLALDALLEILMRDKTWNEGLARKTYIAILEIMEPQKARVEQGQIPPQDPVIVSYRRRLSSVVLS
jgi:putative thioredoxin